MLFLSRVVALQKVLCFNVTSQTSLLHVVVVVVVVVVFLFFLSRL